MQNLYYGRPLLDRIHVFAIAVMICTLVIITPLLAATFYPGQIPETQTNSEGHGYAQYSFSQTVFNYPSNVAGVYAQLGYPKILVHDMVAPSIITLTKAIRIALIYGGLSQPNYALITADFNDPNWSLWFAQVYDGFWLLGEGSNEASSYYAQVDGINGTVLKAQSFPTYQPISGRYSFAVNANQAIAAVRSANVPSKFPPGLAQNGQITSISPRIIKFDSHANLDLQHGIDPQLDGKSSLCWVISLDDERANQGGGFVGGFAIDGQTGQLVSGWDYVIVPASPGLFFLTSSSTTATSYRSNMTTTITVIGPQQKSSK